MVPERDLGSALEAWSPPVEASIGDCGPSLEEVGRIESIGDGVVAVSGLPDARLDELLLLEDGTPALVLDLGRDRIGALVLGHGAEIGAGSKVTRTRALSEVPVGDAVLGRVLDPVGRPLDGGPAPRSDERRTTERAAPTVIERALVSEPLHTGITVVDSMFPIGRGQRELVIGDRSTGKTALALDTMIAQRTSDVICVYAAIGQKSAGVRQVVEAMERHGAIDRAVFVVGAAESPPGLQWLAPFAACAIAEYFRDRGEDALLVLDDLTKHAAIHRQIALLLRQPPGREAYPGDIFYLHARLLERGARLGTEQGGGSLTILPLAETRAGNLSAYIPTNLISISDGQLYLDTRLFNEGQKPAVDVGRSVSRVGGKTQRPAMRRLAGSLRLDYAQFLELEMFTRFGATADERTRRTIAHGRRIRALLGQDRFMPASLALELAQLLAVQRGIVDRLEPERIEDFAASLRERLEGSEIADRISEAGEVTDDMLDALANMAEAAATDIAGEGGNGAG